MERRIGRGRRASRARRARARDAAFRGLLWAAAGLTIGILLFIVGYIVVRGLVSDSMVESDFLAYGGASVFLDGIGDVTVIVNGGVRVTDLTAEDVQGLFAGVVTDWGDISGQDLPVRVLLPRGPRPDDAEEAARKVAGTRGGICRVPAVPEGSRAPRGARIVPVRSLCACVNPGVTALRDGRRLSSVTAAQLDSLLRGEIRNWRGVGGPDLPVTVVDPGPDALVKVAAVPGAVAVRPWREAAARALGLILPVQRREVRRNLTLAYLVEQPRRAGKVGGVSTIIGNTLFMIALTLLFITPIGVGAALYLTEYVRQGPLVAVLRFGTETLAGIPSIIFGLFGFIVFVTLLHLGIGLLSGTLTLALMLLPTLIRTSEEAIRSVPDSLRAGSLALGATRWQTTVRVTLPAAAPGILTGVILAVGRAMGETAALLFTMGTDDRLARGLSSSARVLSVHLFFLLKEGISFDRAFASATILVLIVLIVNFTTTRLVGRMSHMQSTGEGHERIP